MEWIDIERGDIHPTLGRVEGKEEIISRGGLMMIATRIIIMSI